MVIFTQQLKFLSRVTQAILIHSYFSKDVDLGPHLFQSREAHATSHSNDMENGCNDSLQEQKGQYCAEVESHLQFLTAYMSLP